MYGGQFASINRPESGARFEQSLPVGKHPIQLFSQGTPNGQKVTILLEELLALGHSGAEYDAWLIDIFKGNQFGSGFVSINPNSKIPALVDQTTNPVTPVFESGSIHPKHRAIAAVFPADAHSLHRECHNRSWDSRRA